MLRNCRQIGLSTACRLLTRWEEGVSLAHAIGMKTDFFAKICSNGLVKLGGGGGVSELKQLQNKLVYDLGGTSIYR